MKIVEKKILPQYFDEVVCGRKSFEYRKDEDGIKPGDSINLKEWDGEKYTGNEVIAQVTYVLRDAEEFGLPDGYCIIGIASDSNTAYKTALKIFMTECFDEMEKRFLYDTPFAVSKEIAKKAVIETYHKLINFYTFERSEK